MTYRELAKKLFGNNVEDRPDFENLLYNIGNFDGHRGSTALNFPDSDASDDLDIVALEEIMDAYF